MFSMSGTMVLVLVAFATYAYSEETRSNHDNNLMPKIIMLKNNIAEFKSDVAAKELEKSTKIMAQEKLLSMLDTKIANLQSTLAEQAIKSSVQETRIADLHAKIADQDTTIANLRAGVDLSASQINTLKLEKVCGCGGQCSASNEATGRLNHLLDRVVSLEDGEKWRNCTREAIQQESEPYGAVYTRWGHDQCPESQTTMVYTGYVGGARYDHQGGAADYLCLTKTPTQYTHPSMYTSGHGYLYGGEYQFALSNSKHDHDVPCAVCQSVSRTSAIMLPGSDVCPKGWYLEYKGLLMSGYHNHKAASQHICVDYAKKTLDGGTANEDGKLLYPVKTRCGTLRCPPYVNDQFVTCAVCTR